MVISGINTYFPSVIWVSAVTQLFIAEVVCVAVCRHLSCVLSIAQDPASGGVKTEWFRTCQLDSAIYSCVYSHESSAAATSSATIGCMRTGDRRTVLSLALPPAFGR